MTTKKKSSSHQGVKPLGADFLNASWKSLCYCYSTDNSDKYSEET